MESTVQSCIKIIFYRPYTSYLSSPCLNLNSIGYVWSDKSPVEFTRWNPQQPDSHHGQQPCVEMYSSGEWGDTGCYSIKQFICKMPRCKLSLGRAYCITAVIFRTKQWNHQLQMDSGVLASAGDPIRN